MVLDPHRWLELRRFRSLYESGAMSLREIAKETGLYRRTVSKYLKGSASLAPPKREAAGQRPWRLVDEVAPLIDAMLTDVECVMSSRWGGDESGPGKASVKDVVTVLEPT